MESPEDKLKRYKEYLEEQGTSMQVESPDGSRLRSAYTHPYGSDRFRKFIDTLPHKDDVGAWASGELGEDEVPERLQRVYPTIFYHVTPTVRVKQILREGLKAGKSRTLGRRLSPRFGLYLGEDPEDLIRDILSDRTLSRESRTKSFTLLKIIVPKDTPIGEDPEFSEDTAGLGYWVIFGDIPSKNIEIVRNFKV